ncbi:MAG: AI-2E family transporter [Rhodospirillaceae bacterium]|nr:AI-2E family transporter [Rhodospirillaceae bacterium]
MNRVSIERRVLWSLAILLAVGFILYMLRGVLLPFVAGMAIAYCLDPLCDRIQRLGLSRTWATAVVTTVFALIVLILLAVLVPLLYEQFVALAENLPEYIGVIADKIDPLLAEIRQIAPGATSPDLGSVAGTISSAMSWIGGAIGGILTGSLAFFNVVSLIFVTPIVAFYLLRDWDRIVAKIDSWLPPRHAPVVRQQMHEIDRTLAGFARGQATICLFLAGFYGIGLTAIGLNFGLAIGVFAGLLSFIPYVGSIVGLIVSVGLAYVQFDNWAWVAVTAGIFILGQAIEGNILQPKLLGENVGLHPVWVIFALLAGGALFGFLGLLLAVPVMAVIGVVSRFALGRFLASRLFDPDGADNPPTSLPPPPAL